MLVQIGAVLDPAGGVAPGRASLTASNAGVRGSGECSRNPDRLLAKKFSKMVHWGMRRRCAVRTLLSLPEEVKNTAFEKGRRWAPKVSLYPGIAGMLMSTLGEIAGRSGASLPGPR
jgi:hypothetical protein